MNRNHKKKSKPKEPRLGATATRFIDHLNKGLHAFQKCFEEYAPHYVKHEHQIGLLFSQLPVEKHGDTPSAKTAVIATEEGIAFSNGGLLQFNNEFTPEGVALVFLAALVLEKPIHSPPSEKNLIRHEVESEMLCEMGVEMIKENCPDDTRMHGMGMTLGEFKKLVDLTPEMAEEIKTENSCMREFSPDWDD